MTNSVSIVMVSYNTGPALWLGIEAALAQPECTQLVLVNNGNTPHDVERMQALAAREPRITFLTGHGNVGFAKGCNIASAKATGDYLLLLNPDAMLPDGALTRALATITTYPEKTLAGCFLMNPDGTEQRGGRRALMTPGNAISESLGLQRWFGKESRLYFHGDTVEGGAQEVPVISGAFMLLRRSFYASLGGLDEGYFLHMDDADFCYRVHKAGGKVIFLPDVKMVHFLSTSEVSSAFVEKQKAKGFIRYMRTHFADQYSMLTLNVLAAGIWLRCYFKLAFNSLDRVFSPPLEPKQDIARLVALYRYSRFPAHGGSLAGKTVLVLGGSGQVGTCAIGKALRRGARVIATRHSRNVPFTHPNLEWVQCDLADAQPLENVKVDIVIGAAALWLLTAALPKLKNSGVSRIVALSSTAVAGKLESTDANERDVAKKIEDAEKELMSAKEISCAVTIFRTTMMYGIGLDSNITRMADVVRRFGILPIYAPASGLRHSVQVQDVADALLDIADNPRTFGKVYNLGSKQCIPYRAMLEAIFRYMGKPVRLFPFPFMPQILDALGSVYTFTRLNGEVARRMNKDQVFDIQPAIDDFGWNPNEFLEGEAVI